MLDNEASAEALDNSASARLINRDQSKPSPLEPREDSGDLFNSQGEMVNNLSGNRGG